MPHRLPSLLGKLFLLAMAALLGPSWFAAAQQPAEQQMLVAVNADRAQQGLPPLRWNAALAAAALAHAQAMEAADTLSHQLSGEPDVPARTSAAGAHFQAVAENIAYGYSAKSIENEWMHSAPHRSNILDPRMNAVGIALVPGHGVLWAVEDFAAMLPALTPREVEQTVENELSTRGVAIAPPGSAEQVAARSACPQFEGPAGAHARFVVRWESSDLHQFPAPLTTALGSHQYTRAAVGACAAINQRNQDFTAYRVAVLLF